jgi:CYTH domain-containing protein
MKNTNNSTMGIEIEKKYIIPNIPFNINNYKYERILQGYISTNPVIRIRQMGSKYYVTCKSQGLMIRNEFEISITKDQFKNLEKKVDYNIISKNRYYIPLEENLLCELDIFNDNLNGLIIAEVEFDSPSSANSFIPPKWFGDEITENPKYQNSYLCKVNNLTDLE